MGFTVVADVSSNPYIENEPWIQSLAVARYIGELVPTIVESVQVTWPNYAHVAYTVQFNTQLGDKTYTIEFVPDKYIPFLRDTISDIYMGKRTDLWKEWEQQKEIIALEIQKVLQSISDELVSQAKQIDQICVGVARATYRSLKTD